jgi:hypothetical protein
MKGKPKKRTGLRLAREFQLVITVVCGLYGFEGNVGILVLIIETKLNAKTATTI